MSPDLKTSLDEFKSFQMEARPAIEVKVPIIFYSMIYHSSEIMSVKKIQSCSKWKKNIWFFLFQKYGKFWSILLDDNFITHKPLIFLKSDRLTKSGP